MYDKVTLRVDLNEEKTTEFKAIKDYHGLENNAEVIRILISEAYRRIAPAILDHETIKVAANG